MPEVRLLADVRVSGASHSAGDEIEVTDQDASILVGCGRAVLLQAPGATATTTTKPQGRSKAEIAADLAAARQAEAQLQADLSQATE